MSKITEITEIHDVLGIVGYGSAEGWQVVTDDQTITVAVSNSACCCESWGYFSTDDDPQKFVGADLLKVERVSEGEEKRLVTLIPDHPYGLDEGGAIFVNLVTDRGTFQLAVYNAHNGYYGHDAVVISRDLNVAETL